MRLLGSGTILQGDEVEQILQAAWDSVGWPEAAEEIELVRSDEEDATPVQIWPGETHWRQVDGRLEASGNLWVNAPSVDLAFQIFWVVDGEEWPVGTFAARHGAVRAFGYSEMLDIDPPQQIDIILRPSADVAIRQLSTRRIWGEIVRVEGIRPVPRRQ